MLKNLILSAAAAGVAAGLFTAVVQHVTTTPIIIEAEKYEGGAPPHDHGARHAGARSWRRADAARRDVDRREAAAVRRGRGGRVGAGRRHRAHALHRRSRRRSSASASGWRCSARWRSPACGIDARTGLAFGVAGFIAVALAPALGLPPEIPGSGAAELGARQTWWFFAVGGDGDRHRRAASRPKASGCRSAASC